MRSRSFASASRSWEMVAVLFSVALGRERDVDPGRAIAPVELCRLGPVAVRSRSCPSASHRFRSVGRRTRRTADRPAPRRSSRLRAESVGVLADRAAASGPLVARRPPPARSRPAARCSSCSAIHRAISRCVRSAAPHSSSASNHSSHPRPVRSRIVSSDVASTRAAEARRVRLRVNSAARAVV